MATVRVGSKPSRYRYEAIASGPAASSVGPNAPGNVTLERYGNGSAVLQRLSVNENSSSGVLTDRQGDPFSPGEVRHGTPRNAGRLLTLLGSAENVTVTSEKDGSYQLRATDLAQTAVTVAGVTIEDPTSVQFSATITADGLVRAYHIEINGTVDGQPVTATEQVRYTALGTTTVQRPSWYTAAAGNHTT